MFADISTIPSSIDTVAVIGPYSSGEARTVTNLAGLFHVPVISATATSTLLSDKNRLKYFLRTVPSDLYQVKAISHLLKRHNWNFIILLVSDSEYGRSAQLAFKEEHVNAFHPFCTEVEEVLSHKNMEGVYKKILAAKKAKVIVAFIDSDAAINFIGYAYKQNLRGYTWIASDSWNKNPLVIQGREPMLKGMVGFSPYQVETKGFRQHLIKTMKLKDKSSATNSYIRSHYNIDLWTKEFIRYSNLSCVKNKSINCNDEISKVISPYETSSIIMAVKAVALAVHKILDCDSTWCKKKIKDVDWSLLADFIRNVQLNDASNQTIFLDETKTSSVEYKIFNLQEKDGKYVFAEVGKWHTLNKTIGKLNIFGQMQWNNASQSIPKSFCSEPCLPG